MLVLGLTCAWARGFVLARAAHVIRDHLARLLGLAG